MPSMTGIDTSISIMSIESLLSSRNASASSPWLEMWTLCPNLLRINLITSWFECVSSTTSKFNALTGLFASIFTGRFWWSLVNTGIFIVNDEPTCSLLSTMMVPRIISTKCLVIARPNPVPPKRLVIDLSPWWKAVNKRACLAFDIPMPVSETEIISSSFCSKTETLTVPLSVNLIALPIRLNKTWDNLVESIQYCLSCGMRQSRLKLRFLLIAICFCWEMTKVTASLKLVHCSCNWKLPDSILEIQDVTYDGEKQFRRALHLTQRFELLVG